MERATLIFLICWAALGCVSATPQADQWQRDPLRGPAKVMVADVPFIEQKAGHCGPATLAMVAGWAGRPLDVDELARRVYVPGAGGSLQSDLVSAARREGFMAVPLRGLPSLMAELEAGHPVIVFENLALSWLPQWHYAVVMGFDGTDVIMHSGPEAFKRWDLRKFERSWKLADYWGLVVLPAGRLAASAGETDHVTAAAGLEQADRRPEARDAFESILRQWPQSLGARIGMANLADHDGDPVRAIAQLKKAVTDHPEAAAAWHNLAVAQSRSRDLVGARRSAREALRLATGPAKAAFQENLAELLPQGPAPETAARN